MVTEKSLTDNELRSAIFNLKNIIDTDLINADHDELDNNTRIEIMRSIEINVKTLETLITEQINRAIAKHDFEAQAKANYAHYIRTRMEDAEKDGEARSV